MEEKVPSPLRISSPVVSRKQSVDNVPEALRAGSPAVERGTPSPFSPISPDGRPRLERRRTSDRLSQLFPSRPPSAASISPDLTSSRRTSYPSPLTPATEPAYRIPRAPAPPTFSEDTSYNPIPDPFEQRHEQPTLQKSASKRLINRLSSLRSGRTGGRGTYGRLEDEESGRSKLRDLDEQEEPVGYDLSGLDGMPMKKFSPTAPKKLASAADAMEAERTLNEAGFAAEYERLEEQLGAGMNSVVEKPFVYQASQPTDLSNLTSGLGKTQSSLDPAHSGAQEEADKSGEILAVSEIPLDISESFGGADFERRSMVGTIKEGSGSQSRTSYYFPPDPEQPSWRPFSMAWPWITMLIIIAVALAALQEFLCQLSIRRAKDNKGLIEFKKPNDLTLTEYFTWKYSPVLVFVIYGILWQITDFEVKRLEPYYQLSQKTGASAAESLNMDYLSFMSWLVPLRALRHKQYAVIWSALGTLVSSSLVPVLQSASVEMWPKKHDRKVEDLKFIRIDPIWSRCVTVSLLFVAIFGASLSFQLRRKSGLLSDPKGIAGIAAMATRSHILADFNGLDTAPLNKIHKQLRHRRYILHKSSLWQGEYIRNSKERVPEHGSDPRPLMLRLRAGVPYICFIIIFTIMVPIFMFVEGLNVVTEKIPFFLTAIATIIKLLWGTMTSDVRALEPFFVLAGRNAPPQTLTLDYTGTNPIWLPIKSFMNKHYIVTAAACGAVLTEVLTVCVSSFSVDGTSFIPGEGHTDKDNDRYNSAETFRSFWVSFALVLGILLTLVTLAILIYMRRSHKFMPRQIGSISSVLAFIHQSRMLVNFVDTEQLDTNKMESWLKKQGKRYALGWFNGRDGEDHLGIDEEPILAEYQWGVDRRLTRVLGHQVGAWEQY